MLDTMLKNHIIELHNQEMDYQLRKQAKLIEELNEVIINQRKLLNKNGIKIEDDENIVIADDDSLIMEEFENSETELSQIDKEVEEELVEQLEDFETMRDNVSDNEDNEDNDNINETDLDNKENDK